MKGCKDIHESLNELLTFETLEGDNQYECSRCDKKVDAKKGVKLGRIPPILTMSLR